jgi:hypothetical protein
MWENWGESGKSGRQTMNLQQVLAKQRERIQANNSRLRKVRAQGQREMGDGWLRKHEHRCKFAGAENVLAREKIRELKRSGFTYRDIAGWYDCSPNTIERIVKRRGNYARF